MFYESINPATTSQEWYTPPYIFDALGCRFDLDPASPGPTSAVLSDAVAGDRRNAGVAPAPLAMWC